MQKKTLKSLLIEPVRVTHKYHSDVVDCRVGFGVVGMDENGVDFDSL